VYSYADLAANIDGFYFWQNMTRGVKPFIVCRQGQWIQEVGFNWKKYVNDAWDEGINCSDYDASIKEGVLKNIRTVLSAKGYKAKKCPLFSEKCVSLRERYKSTPFVLHPDCRK
jgi:hypothetical protein